MTHLGGQDFDPFSHPVLRPFSPRALFPRAQQGARSFFLKIPDLGSPKWDPKTPLFHFLQKVPKMALFAPRDPLFQKSPPLWL